MDREKIIFGLFIMLISVFTICFLAVMAFMFYLLTPMSLVYYGLKKVGINLPLWTKRFLTWNVLQFPIEWFLGLIDINKKPKTV